MDVTYPPHVITNAQLQQALLALGFNVPTGDLISIRIERGTATLEGWAHTPGPDDGTARWSITAPIVITTPIVTERDTPNAS